MCFHTSWTLDIPFSATVTYNTHLSKTAKKVAARVNLVRKLTGRNWGASAGTLRTASLELVYSTAKYCALSWLNSVHTNKIDIQLNNTVRLISGTVKSTQLQWLPVLVNIAPPKLRREETTICELAEGTRCPSCTNRCWIFPIKGCFLVDLCEILIHIYHVRPPGFDLRRHNWVVVEPLSNRAGKIRAPHA
jgi:hypothetical protein